MQASKQIEISRSQELQYVGTTCFGTKSVAEQRLMVSSTVSFHAKPHSKSRQIAGKAGNFNARSSLKEDD